MSLFLFLCSLGYLEMYLYAYYCLIMLLLCSLATWECLCLFHYVFVWLFFPVAGVYIATALPLFVHATDEGHRKVTETFGSRGVFLATSFRLVYVKQYQSKVINYCVREESAWVRQYLDDSDCWSLWHRASQ